MYRSTELLSAPAAARLAWSSVRVDYSTWTWTGGLGWVAAEHGNTRAELGTTQGDHMLADVAGNLLALVVMSVHEDPLDEIVAVLVASDVDERDAWTIWVGGTNDTKVAVKELNTANLEALLNDFGSELVDAVAVGVGEDVVDDATLVWRRAMLTQVLYAPITELAVSNEVNASDDFFDGGALLFFDTVLKDILDDQAASLTKSNLMPHTTKSFVDLEHDLRWLT